ncbi:MAG: hypothetical protein RR639_00425 [Hydrogenoanaerobacterium sp.]
MTHQINFKTLIYQSLKKWRTIVVVMLIFAVVAGAVSVAKEVLNTTQEVGVETHQTTVEILERQISQIRKKAAQIDALLALQVEKNLADDEENHSEALFAINMKSPLTDDGSDATYEQNLYSVKLEEIKYLYYAMINNLTTYDELNMQLKLGIDSYQLRDLVKQSHNYNSILLSVSGFDAKTNIAIRDAMVDKIQLFARSINGDGPTHTLQLTDTSSTVVRDATWKNTVAAAKDQKKELSVQLTQLERQVTQPPMPTEGTDKPNLKLLAKLSFYIAVGLLCGFMIGILLVLGQTILSSKIYGLEDLQNGYDISTLGEIYVVNTKKKRFAFSGIDRLIYNIFFSNDELKYEVCKELLLRKINCMAADGQKILCVVQGDQSADILRETLSHTVFSQANNEFSSSSISEMLVKHETALDLKALDTCTGIILLTTYSSVTFSKLNRLIDVAILKAKPILGLVGISVKEQV